MWPFNSLPKRFQLRTELERLFQAAFSSLLTGDQHLIRLLFFLSYADLCLAAKEGSPLEHPFIVAGYALEIARGECLPYRDWRVLAVAALLHDIAPFKRVRVRDIPADEDGHRAQLEASRIKWRQEHMAMGVKMVRVKLDCLPGLTGYRTVFFADEIRDIIGIIGQHDNPSIGISIPDSDRLAVIHREADRLWMLSQPGFTFDLNKDQARDPRGHPDLLMRQRFYHVEERFRQERDLYSPADRSFVNDSYFFRTLTGFDIFRRLQRDREMELIPGLGSPIS